MNLRKTAEFVADMELQYQWYGERAGWDVAERYLRAVEATCALIGTQPLLGPNPRLAHPRLADWRFFVVLRPFHRHVIFYEVAGDAVEMRRAMDGRRDLPRRLLEPPGAG